MLSARHLPALHLLTNLRLPSDTLDPGITNHGCGGAGAGTSAGQVMRSFLDFDGNRLYGNRTALAGYFLPEIVGLANGNICLVSFCLILPVLKLQGKVMVLRSHRRVATICPKLTPLAFGIASASRYPAGTLFCRILPHSPQNQIPIHMQLHDHIFVNQISSPSVIPSYTKSSSV